MSTSLLTAALLRTALLLALLVTPGLAPTASGQDAPAAEAGGEDGAEDGVEAGPEEEPEPPLLVEARSVINNITRLRAEIAALEQQSQRMEGEQAAIVQRQIRRRWFEQIRQIDALTDTMESIRKNGLDASAFEDAAHDPLIALQTRLPEIYGRVEARIAELRKQLETVEDAQKRNELDAQLARQVTDIDILFKEYATNISRLERLEIDTKEYRDELRQAALARAERLSGVVQIAADRLAEAQRLALETPDDTEVGDRVRVAQAHLDRVASSYGTVLQIAGDLGVDTATYRQILVQATGKITSDVLDTELAVRLLREWTDDLQDWASERAASWAFNASRFALVLALFWAISVVTRRVVSRAALSSGDRLSRLAREMMVNLVGQAILILGLFVALSQLGLQIGPLLAGLGVAGFIVGFALQDTLGNFASGGMILIYRPFDVGDTVEAAGIFGKVSHMSLVSTTILTFDNQTLVVPNSKIWGDVIRNVTHQQTRRVDLEFGISYADDVGRAEDVLASILKEHPSVLEDPEPIVKLHKLGDSAVEFVVRPWVRTEDYWDVYWDVTREVKVRFDREGISIPFPQQTVHVEADARLRPSEAPDGGGPPVPASRPHGRTDARSAAPGEGGADGDD